MQGKIPGAMLHPWRIVALATFCIAIGAGPAPTAAQTSTEAHKDAKRGHDRDHDNEHEHKKKAKTADHDAAARHQREAEERTRREAAKRERPQTRNPGQQAIDRERKAAERREREQWERQEIVRRQDAMRDADNERAAERGRQNARWADEMQQRRDADRKAAQPASRGPYSLDAFGTPAPSTAPGNSASRGTRCSAQPSCPAESGYGNVCKGVSRNYASSSSAATGLQDIVSRCRTANLPDLCNAKFHLTFGGGCAQQCASVAQCTATAAR